MKTSYLVSLTLIFSIFYFMSCTKEEANIRTIGEINAELINKIIMENDIKWVKIYEHNPLNGEWVLAAWNQSYTSKSELC